MTIGVRTYGGDRRFSRCYRIRSGGFDLLVEERDLYTRYRLESVYTGQTILWHEVRSPEPVPIRPAQIIHSRHIPWFMWLIYAVRDWHRKRLSDRELDEWWKEDQERRAAIRQAVKDRGLGRFGGRYNR